MIVLTARTHPLIIVAAAAAITVTIVGETSRDFGESRVQKCVTTGRYFASDAQARLLLLPPREMPLDETDARDEMLRDLLASEVANAAADGWDGPGTLPASSDAVDRAYALISLLPASLPVGEISVTPSGSISFDWDKGPVAQLSILATSNGISFASFIDGRKATGFDPREIDCLDQQLLCAIGVWTAYEATNNVASAAS